MMKQLSPALTRLARALDDLGANPSVVDLIRTVEAVDLEKSDVSSFVKEGSHSYHRASVLVREHYEILVLTWTPGQFSPPHDHSGAVSVVRVVQGRGTESCFSVASDGYADLEHRRALLPGDITSFHDASVHAIGNATPKETLVTLHVYAPPLREGRRFVERPMAAAVRRAPREGANVAILGGGFSGCMTAAHLLQEARSPLHVVLFERRGALAEGVAYSTREPSHLLNVPAGNMSAWSNLPDHFWKWARQHDDRIGATDFLPRQLYAEYVRETLRAAASGSAGRLSISFDEVRRLEPLPAGRWMVHLANSPSWHADVSVLAVGHCQPSDPIGTGWSGSRARYITDPWRPFATNAVTGDEPVLIMGSGLTAVDTVLSLTAHPRSAKITLVSVNGLIPQGHAASRAVPVDLEPLISQLLGALAFARMIRAQAREAGRDWRAVIDGMRPHTQRVWHSMSSRERARFLRRLRPFWEVHRHRMAPSVDVRFRELIHSGQVEIVAGRVKSVHEHQGDLRVRIHLRSAARTMDLPTAWVINCTGPLPSNRIESNPVIGSLLVRGLLSPDALSLGIDTTDRGHALNARGNVLETLLVVGTLRKPALWESTAVPELRQQAADVARQLLAQLEVARPAWGTAG